MNMSFAPTPDYKKQSELVYTQISNIIKNAASGHADINNCTLSDLAEKVNVNLTLPQKIVLVNYWFIDNSNLYTTQDGYNAYFYSLDKSKTGITYNATTGLFMHETINADLFEYNLNDEVFLKTKSDDYYLLDFSTITNQSQE